MTTEIRPCRSGDLPAVALLFRRAFAVSVEALVPGAAPRQELFEDIFALLHRALPGDLFVLEEGGRIRGYLVAPGTGMERLWRYALLSGALLRWAGKWLLGRYGVPLRALPGVIRNKLLFVRTEKGHTPAGRYGRILSIALAEGARGRGLGKLLVGHGLEHLRGRGLSRVKLEVRPDNLPAVRAYLAQGFVEAGRTRDLQGDWLVMTREL